MSSTRPSVVVIGAGPAGLMAAEILSETAAVTVCDAMPTAGRKFLMAGVGGMNITHSEPLERFISRYGDAATTLAPWLNAFGPSQLRAWIHDLGIATFVGSSGRVFPNDMKAAPLLRAWLQRLKKRDVRFLMRHRWQRSDGNIHYFQNEQNTLEMRSDAVIFALGGGSWRKLGSDGSWVSEFGKMDVAVSPLQPSNCGFNVRWSEHLRQKCAGQPIKPVTVSITGVDGLTLHKQGEFVLTHYGIEGSVIYFLSAAIRQRLLQDGSATVVLDLLPSMSLDEVMNALKRPQDKKSFSTFMQKTMGIKDAKLALLYEALSRDQLHDRALVARTLKSLPLKVVAMRDLDEAISSAGGVRFDELDEHLMLKRHPGYFCAGEMLDWEAPTGGYLLTGCFATGYHAGLGARAFLTSLKR